MNRKTQALIAGAGAAAAVFAVKALSGKHIDTLPYGYGIKIKKSVTINCSAERLYAFWRDLRNIPTLFDKLLSVEVLDSRYSYWSLKVPGGVTLEWDAEITVDRQDEMIGWRSLADAEIDNAGYVKFEPATGGRGTVVRVALQYNPPAGKVGAAAATLMGEKPATLIEEALRKLKQLAETGGIAVATGEQQQSHFMEPVELASEDSFPASDPPGWTGTTGSL